MSIDPENVQSLLRTLFPDATIDDHVIVSVQAALAAGRSAPPPAEAGATSRFSYYMADATHTRVRGTTSTFTGHLPLVRVPLPASGSITDVPNIVTALGFLVPNDRKIASVQTAKDFTMEPVARMDLLTPARAPGANGGRFGAVALYLAYANFGDARPSSYILEAGTATGQPDVIFPSTGMNDIVNQQTNYLPTPFSKVTNFYSGRLTMQGDEPDTLLVSSTDTSGVGPGAGDTPYITVTIKYTKLTAPPPYDPIALLVEAAARVGKIGNAMGANPGVAPEIAAVLDGRNLTWTREPGT